MLNFAGFEDWVEIFRGGPQTDNLGRDHDGDALVDKALATWDPKFHEPPAVVGHPTEDAPAYGWVTALQVAEADGQKVLLARFRDVEPDFAEMVKTGRFPKRSASFYPDGRLRHVGFLGAAPPAVKGLKNIKFTADSEAIAFDFSNKRKEFRMKFSEFMQAINIFKKLGGKDEDIDLIAPETKPAAAGGQFTEADIEAAKKQAAEEAKKQAAAEFAEAEKKRTADAARAGIAAFCEKGVASGKLAPAWVASGIKEFMANLADMAPVEFGEEKKSQAPLDWFMAFMEGLPKLVDFTEIATRAKNTGAGSAGQKLAQLTKKRMEEKKDLTYSAAFAEVQGENPELAKEYMAEFTG